MLPTAAPGPEGTETPRAEDLCTACGLCCSGVLFKVVILYPGETFRLSRKLPIHDDLARQPCTALGGDGRCTIYEVRPYSCSKYACAVLKAAQTGAMTWEDATARIARTRALVAAVRRAIGGTGHLLSDLERFVEDSPEWRRAHADLLLDVETLRALLRGFEDSSEDGT